MKEMSKNLCFRKRNRNVSESSESENDRKRRRKRKKRSYWMESESGDTDENTSFTERSGTYRDVPFTCDHCFFCHSVIS